MNDYYALMQAMQTKKPNPWNQRTQVGVDAITKITQAVLANKVKKNIEEKITKAEKQGKKVEYKIDPQSGLITPVISSQSYETIFEALKNPDVAEKYELGRGAKGEPRLIKKKGIKPNVISGIQSALSGDQDTILMKNPATMQDEKIDISIPEGADKAMKYLGIEDWRNNPELIEAGIPSAYEKRLEARKVKTDQIEASTEPRVQPYATGLGRMGSMGAEYKEATVKYGEAKTKKIVDGIITYQKQGRSLKQIRKLLEEAGADADVFLKPYGK